MGWRLLLAEMALCAFALLHAIEGKQTGQIEGNSMEPGQSRVGEGEFVDLAERLPEKMIVGYANWCQCDEKIVEAAKDGVNTVIWFNTNLIQDDNGNPKVESCTNFDCVGRITKQLRENKLETVHLMSIGGWNAPHPDTKFTGKQWFKVWDEWNKKTAARPELGFKGFDGFDWDIEGNNNVSSEWNTLTVDALDVMGEMSQEAKKAGYIVSMAPAQSYLDPESSKFFTKLTFPPHISDWHQDFMYHGRNAYAYLLAKYGIQTFDFITVQLYEGWSRANFEITEKNTKPAKYVTDLVKSFSDGWDVDIGPPTSGKIGSTHSKIGSTHRVRVPPSKVVIGLSNGWALESEGKFLYVEPSKLQETMCAHTLALSTKAKFNEQQPENTHQILHVQHSDRSLSSSCTSKLEDEPRGFGFWNIEDEGKNDVRLASALNQFLRTRKLLR